MGLILAGCGGGDPEGMTVRTMEAIKEADLVIGSKRLLESLKGYIKSKTFEAAGFEKQLEIINDLLKKDPDKKIVVLFSGDTGIFSGAETLGKALSDAGFEYETEPGVSSFALMAAAMKRSYRGALLLSAHGREINITQEIMKGRDIYVLTGGINTPNKLCKQISESVLPSLKACVGTFLGYVNQRLICGTVSELSEMDFEGPAVLFIEAPSKITVSTPGIPDGEFIRGDVPMTKRMIRAAALSLLKPRETDVCWDLGAGTGSVSVELAMFSGKVYAVERKPEAISLIEKNREKFGAWNIKVVPGEIEECIGELEMPDKIFIGGSGGRLQSILERILEINPKADVVITAVTLDTLNLAVSVLEGCGRDPEVMQIGVSRAEKTGKSRLLKAENPVFIISSIQGMVRETASGKGDRI